MTEENVRAELIDPKLKDAGWGEVDYSKIERGYSISRGKIQVGGRSLHPLKADFVLIYKNRYLAVIEAKRASLEVGEGVAQAKEYAQLLQVETTFSTNGKEIYQICMETGEEKLVDKFPTPEELWRKTFAKPNEWRDKFNAVAPNESKFKLRFYQELAINKVLDAIAEKRNRILLTMATGTGKTAVAFQIVWKLFESRWNLQRDGNRRPRILFLVDRNFLANQAFNSFSPFDDDALVRINPQDIKKRGGVPTNGGIFFTIFQTFMSGKKQSPYFGEYPQDFFDFIIVDECHRGGSDDESQWRGILEYFSPAVQLGLTATPKQIDNANTYQYFGMPVYTYSLKEGINHGFLTPFRVKSISTTMDNYTYAPDDYVLEGEVEEGRLYKESEFNKKIQIREREAKRVEIMLENIDQREKTLVFCTDQEHAAIVRDFINQKKESKEPNYCVRVTANDGKNGEQYLSHFQDNEKSIPTILTTSRKLSTGADAKNIRNIVLLRTIDSMIEFKQIIGRGTRTFEGKEFFTILDFTDACDHFSDPNWDGNPEQIEQVERDKPDPPEPSIPSPPSLKEDHEPKQKLKIKLRDGKEREIDHMIETSFMGTDGRPISSEEFIKNLYGKLPDFFKSEEELRKIWSIPSTRDELLRKLEENGFGQNDLNTLRDIINAKKSDLFDVLEYIAFSTKPITREERVQRAKSKIVNLANKEQKDFLDFVLSHYIESGVGELSEEKLDDLINLKYGSPTDAVDKLGPIDDIRHIFINFQKHLYSQPSTTV